MMMKKLAINPLKGLAWFALAVLLLVPAWLASNNRWVDARSDAVPAALQRPAATLPDERNGFFLFGFAWYNTVGPILLDVGWHSYADYADYAKRHADLLLHHQAALLALQAAAQPPAGRAAWLASQPMDESMRARIRLDGTRQIVASPWSKQDTAANPTVYPIARLQDS